MKSQSQTILQFAPIQRIALFSRIILILILTHFIPLAHSAEVTLTWDPNTESDLSGYKIYYGYETGNYEYSIDVGDTTSYQVAGLEDQTIYFVATAYDVNGNESEYSKEVVFTPENQPPVADAGPDQTVDEGTVAILSGANSSDPEGGALSYSWKQTGGSKVVLSDPESAKPDFVTPDVGPDGESLTFRLTVSDPDGSLTEDDCTVNVSWVNIPPTADAGVDINVEEGYEVILNGAGSSDTDDDIVAYLWKQTGGPEVEILNPTNVQASFIAPDFISESVSLTFKLTVQDSGGLIADDTCVVNVIWQNTPPTADAGQDQTVSENDTVYLDGSGSMDPDDGIASIRWTQTKGTPVTLSDPAAKQPKFVAPSVESEGADLVFQLSVTDMGGLTSQDSCTVIVNSQAEVVYPTADIKINGQDGPVTVKRNSSVTVSLSIDPGDYKGKTVDLWLVVESPSGEYFYAYKSGWGKKSTPLLQYPLETVVSYDVLTTSLSIKGNYVFRFAIDDNADGQFNGTWIDTVSVTVVK
ncbi:conserved hypothetical protein [delta proteobacterium NaphS2]|nr:conserved hypothetical protein [delta proteobacterium NaphS2]